MDMKQIAQAFANGKAGTCHNARTDGVTYTLHNSPIVVRQGNAVVFHWHGFYTKTTAAHMNHILRAFGAEFRVSFAQARDKRETHFVLELEPTQTEFHKECA
jgi:hypothetical protein